jgi:TolB-like protein/Tfp pilus assembly protein PilF
MASVWGELKRRNVLRVGAAYVVVAWLLIQVAETIFPLFGFDEAPARIVVIVLAICFLPALVLAWVFELTPEGLKRDKDVDREQVFPLQTGRKLDRVIMVALALALGYFAFDKFVLEPAREARLEAQRAAEVEQARQEGRSEALAESYSDQSIAVLAFEDMSVDKDQEYLSDGIAEELLTRLARVPDLRVISRSSAFSYKGKGTRLDQIAEELKVAHVLEGSVRKAGNRVRVTAQLIDARSDSHLWSESYDRTLDDIFAIQDDIAARIVAELKVSLLGGMAYMDATDPEAYALLLQARHLKRLASADAYAQAAVLLQRALVIDPDHAPTWIVLASIYSNQTNIGQLPRDEGYAMARDAAEKALAIDPGYGPAHDLMGWIALNLDNDLAEGARRMQRAMELEPRDTAIMMNAAALLSFLGRPDEAVVLLKYVTSRNPVDAVSHMNLGVYYLRVNQFDDALGAIRTALRLSPDYNGAHYRIGLALLFKGEPQAALEAFTQEQTDQEYRVKGLALASHALGRETEFQARLAELIDGWGERWPAEIAHVYALTGNTEAAIEWLEKEFDINGSVAPNLDGPYFYTPLNGNRRYMELLELSGNLPAQLDAIEFEVILPQ